MLARSKALSALVVVGALSAMPAYAVQRAFVASYGNDANTATNCTFANPCRSFTAALTITDPGGEIVALDAAGYGIVTINKSVTLTANPGFYAGISASAGNAVTIATAGVNVVLRGLFINGTGGGDGVRLISGASLTIENCVIANFVNSGVNVLAAAAVRISDSTIRDNTNGVSAFNGANVDVARVSLKGNDAMGIYMSGDAAGIPTTATVSDTIVTGGAIGMLAASIVDSGIARISVTRSTASKMSDSGVAAQQTGGGTARISISGSMLAENAIGMRNTGATVESQGNNTVRNNGADTSGTITTFSGI